MTIVITKRVSQMKPINFISISFFVFTFSAAFALSDVQLQAINELAEKSNVTNATLISLFEQIDDKYSKSQIDAMKNNLEYNISIVRSSVNLDIANLISNYNADALENVSENAIQRTKNITDNIISQTDKRFENIEDNYASMLFLNDTEMKIKNNLTSSMNTWAISFNERLENNFYYNAFFSALFSGIAAGAVFYYSKNKLTVTAKSGYAIRIMDENRRIGTIEEVMTSEDYRNLNEKIWQLRLDTANSKYPDSIKIQVLKKIDEGLIRDEDSLKLASESLLAETKFREKEKIIKETEKYGEKNAKKAASVDKNKR